MRRTISICLLFATLSLVASRALAWNALGHRVVAEIAWLQLEPERRQEVVDTLRRHPRFAEDFVARMPRDVATGDQATQDRWIFWQAAVWPDVCRGGPYDRPTWHYVNRPTFLDGKRRPVGAQLSTKPRDTPVDKYNCIQAVKYAQDVLKDREAGPDAKALAYCWLFHLAGDMHQPLHSTALFCDYFPDGDKGGNEIPLVRGRNLHSLWDGLLGRDDRPQGVLREADQLKQNRTLWEVDTTAGPEDWIAEGHELVKSFVYDPVILQAVKDVQPGGEIPPIVLTDEYLKAAGAHARQRVVTGGLRLGAILNDR